MTAALTEDDKQFNALCAACIDRLTLAQRLILARRALLSIGVEYRKALITPPKVETTREISPIDEVKIYRKPSNPWGQKGKPVVA